MANIFQQIASGVFGPKRVSPFAEQGVPGTPIWGGFISQRETNIQLVGKNRHRTAADILVNFSIVAAGTRYFLNLVGKPKWSVERADDSDEAKKAAELIESVMGDMTTSWSRFIRRAGMYRYHGHGVHEWIAKKRPDGQIGLADIRVRPPHTIWRWGRDDGGQISGITQRDPQTGVEVWIPRMKMVYLVDDMMTDSPEGLGWFRALVEPARRLKVLEDLEMIAYERGLQGTPIARAPISRYNDLVAAGTMNKADADRAIAGIEQFAKVQVKTPTLSLLIDSDTYVDQTDKGPAHSAIRKWDIELLKGDMGGIDALYKTIDRITHDMARVIGVQSLLTGAQGKGSLALSQSESENLYLLVNGVVDDMLQTCHRDIVGPVCDLNGIAEEARPKLKAEDVAFKDAAQIAAALRDMGTAGAVLAPDDPAVDDIRDLLGISRQPERTPAETAAMMGMRTAGRPPGRGGAGAGKPAGSLEDQPGAQRQQPDKGAGA